MACASLWGSYETNHILSAAAGALVAYFWGTFISAFHQHFSHCSLELLSWHATSHFLLSYSPTAHLVFSVFHHFFAICHMALSCLP